ncbi:MAG TPA: ABC transporter substrate-binding protein [Chloroflexota bacterium]|nr:ABC transporter substrate-binding protein [Chloroflexota bacterium]
MPWWLPSGCRAFAVGAPLLGVALLALACATPAAPVPAPAATSAPGAGGAAAAASAAPAAVATAPPALARVRLGTLSPSSSDAGWLIAQERGYFQEQRIALDTTPFTTAAEMVPPLGAGQLDAGGGAPSAGLFNAVARGIALRIVADKGGTQRGFGYTSLLVRRELVDGGAVRGPADLRSRKVALPNLGGVSPEAALDRLLQTVGLSTADVDLTVVPFPDQPAAFAGGSVDAGMLIEPFVTLALEQGTAATLARQDEWYPEQQVATIMFSESFASQQADAGRRFVLAYLKGVREYNDAFAKHDEAKRREVIDILVKTTALKDRALWERVAVPSLDPNGQVNKAALEQDQQYYLRTGKQQDHADLDKIVDTSFADWAVQQLGRY